MNPVEKLKEKLEAAIENGDFEALVKVAQRLHRVAEIYRDYNSAIPEALELMDAEVEVLK